MVVVPFEFSVMSHMPTATLLELPLMIKCMYACIYSYGVGVLYFLLQNHSASVKISLFYDQKKFLLIVCRTCWCV